MQLISKRSQRSGGVLGSTAIFCLNARVVLTQAEGQAVQKYKLGPMVVYDSQSRIDLTERAAAPRDRRGIDYGGSVGGMLAGGALSLASGAFGVGKSLALAGLATLKLRVTINSLLHGQYIECKDMNELLAAEEAIDEACQNLRRYIDTAASFDGADVVTSYDGDTPQIVAHSSDKAIAHTDTPDEWIPPDEPSEDIYEPESAYTPPRFSERELITTVCGIAVAIVFLIFLIAYLSHKYERPVAVSAPNDPIHNPQTRWFRQDGTQLFPHYDARGEIIDVPCPSGFTTTNDRTVCD